MSSIQKAAAATAEIDGHVFTALEALRGFDGRIANGYGVYSDPSNLRRDLVEARKAIESASRHESGESVRLLRTYPELRLV